MQHVSEAVHFSDPPWIRRRRRDILLALFTHDEERHRGQSDIWTMTLPGAFADVPHATGIGGALIIIFSGIVAPMISKRQPKQG